MEHLSWSKEGNIVTIIINSPPANALSSGILSDLSTVLDELDQDSSVKTVVLKGEGKFFSAGADIKEFTSFQAESDYVSLAKKGQDLFNRIENYHIPFIASIHGAALGGGLELAMSCHVRVVTKSAKLGLPEMNLGIIPGFAGTQRLPRYVGLPKAYEMVLSSQPITGEEAAQYGLANHAVEDDELDSFTMNLAKQFSSKSGPSIHAVMKLLPYARTSQFQQGVDAESEEFGKVFGNEDAKEGIQAFIEKRKPNFKDQ
ncbi:enoyl-CoA hydratase [Tenuibacillus multivorans]|uniref:Enoyl-CoA hydratase n=1 Tax=Tenuibacillus multivorans TaxID=237069 RepID=A0A1G9ZPU7_9BACI|nr:enoyl-CoA hydratase [Tenuibacillus multivorans]GEL76809.1 enoyl-CoA hydratase [Tenuibacillus multivorans]SDN23439.1 enoyl-CoA hydratase [Tenuibacillus multivorans]